MVDSRVFSANTSSAQGSSATLWHVRISASDLKYFWPGASGHSLRARPLTSLALHVPHVPVAHSYGSSIPCWRAAWRIFAPGAHSKSVAPFLAVTAIFIRYPRPAGAGAP